VLNGVLMGLTLREARRRLDAVLEFAELEEFVDLKLKNYSSGMLVRLAFALMVQADADIMLVDEVLAVGDAAFAHKCMDVFREKRRAGKTVVLVTHDMATVQALCHRAMLIHDGRIASIGDPEQTALLYLRENFERPQGDPGGAVVDFNARLVSVRLAEHVEPGAPIGVDIVLETVRDLDRPAFVFHLVTADGVVVGGFSRRLEARVAGGRRVRLAGEIENRLVGGRYFLDCWIREDDHRGGMSLQALRVTQFAVGGTETGQGIVAIEADLEPVVEGE
jgi:energy-coupling factor transporter ATP-binding protein EcfA2